MRIRTTIDRAGRVVVPKVVRDRLGLVHGTPLEIEIRDGEVVLEPATAAVKLARRGRGVVAEPTRKLPRLLAKQVRTTLEASRR